MLIKGINIISDPEINLSERIAVNAGGIKANVLQIGDRSIDYQPDAYIPGDTWRKPTAAEMQLILNESAEISYKNTIRVLTIPEQVKNILQCMNITSAESINDITSRLKIQDDAVSLLDKELKTLIRRFELPEASTNTYIQGFFVAPPGLPTVTFDRNELFVGLHIDYSADFHKYYKRETVNRFCINIGKEARYFQYINLSVENLEKMINDIAPIDFKSKYESRDLPGIVSKFFEYFPDYPLIKVKLEPYEAYITPSDNIIHDGCSQHMDNFDLSLSLLGFLNPLELAAI